jgi:hypothetical protein
MIIDMKQIRQLGARDGRALAAALASNIPDGATDEQVEGMFQIVVRGIQETAEELIAAGLSESLAVAYRTVCYEVLDREMVGKVRGGQ